MKYGETTTYDLTRLSVHEMSVIQAGLHLLASNARSEAIGGYPEYTTPAIDLLGQINPEMANKLRKRLDEAALHSRRNERTEP